MWSSRRVWNDSGDIAYLIDDKGNIVDQIENGNASKKSSKKKANP